jgi:ESS family glutamate:Na+ symporter
MTEIAVGDFMAFTIGMVVYFVGVNITRRVKLLQEFNIPEPVTGGLLAAIIVFVIYLVADLEVHYDLTTRDQLLVYFFTAIGLNARISDLVSGGKPLLILLVLTITYMVLQNLTGMSVAMMVDLDRSVGVLAGSVSLVGGHGTAIAWAPDFVELGIANALEIGVASATLGLIIASLIGGPIARWLINRNHLSASGSEAPMVGIEYEKAESETINHMSFISVLLTLHIAIILGYAMNEFVSSLGFKLPLFVSCLLMAILLSNTVPRLLPRIRWPARTRALAVLSDYSLGLFLAMSLMSMQLWTIAGLAGPLLIILLLQTTIAVIFILFILFPLMGRDYQAAVLSAGFGGFAMGATPTAIANMTAVTKAHGPAPTAFIILPLVAAFFVDIANAFIIRFALTL